MVHAARERHRVVDAGNRLWPGQRGDRHFIAPAPHQRRGWRALHDAVRLLVEEHARTVGGDFENHAVGIAKVDRREVVAVVWATHADTEIGKPTLPAEQRVPVRHAQRDVMRAANAGAPARCAGPLEEGDHGACTPRFIGEVQVVAARIVKVDRRFDESKTENAGVEVDRALRVAGNEGDVMESKNLRGGH